MQVDNSFKILLSKTLKERLLKILEHSKTFKKTEFDLYLDKEELEMLEIGRRVEKDLKEYEAGLRTRLKRKHTA